MANFQLIIPEGGQNGKTVSVDDFAAEADRLFEAFRDSDVGRKLEQDSEDVLLQAEAAIGVLKELVEHGHVGDAHVFATVNTAIEPDVFPPGSGTVIALHVSSRKGPDAAPAAAQSETSELKSSTDDDTNDVSGDTLNATQAAIDRANELKIDITQIKGTGADGRITKGDVENFKPQQ